MDLILVVKVFGQQEGEDDLLFSYARLSKAQCKNPASSDSWQILQFICAWYGGLHEYKTT